MNLPLDHIARSSRTWTLSFALAVALLTVPASRSQAQYFGYGLGYGYAAGTGGLPFGGPYSASYYNPLGAYGFNYGMSAPMLGVGLTPLGVSSALTEHYMLGRNIPGYSSSYGTVRYRIPANVGVAPGAGTAVVPGTRPGVGANAGTGTGTGTAPGTGAKRP